MISGKVYKFIPEIQQTLTTINQDGNEQFTNTACGDNDYMVSMFERPSLLYNHPTNNLKQNLLPILKFAYRAYPIFKLSTCSNTFSIPFRKMHFFY